MSNANQGFKAFLFHPDFGNEMAEGTLTATRLALHFQSEIATCEIPLDCLVVEREKNGRIHFSDLSQPEVSCFTHDEGILKHWALLQSNDVRPQLKSLARRGDIPRRLKVTAGVLLVCFLMGWLAWYVVNAMVRVIVKQIPASWEQKIGDTYLVELRDDMEFLDDTNREAQLAILAEPLTRAIPGKIKFHFYLVDSPEPNAAALPGGHVMVTTSLLAMMETPEQLLGVIAHEIAHVTCRHAFQQMISGAGPMFILQILLSDRNNRLNIMAQISGVIIYQSFSQGFEFEADETGWKYMVASGVNPHGMIEALRKLKEDVGDGFPGPQILSSHPELDKRIGRLEARWARLPKKSSYLEITNAIPRVPMTNSLEHYLQKPRKRK